MTHVDRQQPADRNKCLRLAFLTFVSLFLLGTVHPALYAQTGTPGNPFTTIGQARTAPNGQYHFNLNGQTFETYVELGKVLIACDPGPGVTSANLASVSLLNTTTRGILPAAAFAQMKNIVKLHLTSSGNSLVLSTTNSTLINRIYTNTTLHQGLADNALNDSWTGTGAAQITGDASCNTTSGATLHENIIHTCGNSGTMNWIPSIGYRRINDGSGTTTETFYLWVEALDHPGGVTGANLWLRANSGATPASGTLTGWADQTSNHTMTVNGNPQISGNAANFNPAVAFDGTGDAIQTAYSASLNTTAFTINTVFKVTGGSGYRAVVSSKNASYQGYVLYINNSNLEFWVGQGGSTWSVMNGGAVPLNKYIQVTAEYNGTASFLYVNGVQVATTTTTHQNNTTFTFRVGMGQGNTDDASFAFIGEIPEVVYFPFALSAADQKKVESYLDIKYSITMGNNTAASIYTSSAGASIYANTTFKYDVFGIGKDDGSGLNQPASNSINTGSGDGTGQSGKGNILIKTPSSLDDGDFLMIGHNNAPLTETMGDLPAGLTKARLQREWKVERTGDVGNVTMEFDFNGLPVSGGTTQLSNYILLIDTDGDGDFTTGTVTQVAPNSFGSPKIIFNGLTLPDGAVFTFVTSPGFPLPLNLLTFTAGSSNCLSNVQWKTANEVNVSRYELQVSFDNSNWSTVHTAAANNSTDVNNYAYSYNHSSRSGNKLLRLKMIDQDGKTTYSKVISVQCGKDNLFTLYPNPASRQVTLTGTKAGEQLQLIAIDGRMMQQHTATEGNSTIGIEALPSGTYLIRVLRNSQWTEAGRFVKQ